MKQIDELTEAQALGIRYVMFDIDDTITKDGRLLEESYSSLWALKRAGFFVVPVTGRPAGWCDLIAREWPVDGVVGENGAFAFFLKGGSLTRLFHPSAPDLASVAAGLDALRREVLASVPGARIAKDQPYRLFDLAVDFAEEPPLLGLDTAQRIKEVCEARGAFAKISSIHVNAWFGAYDKLSMAELFLSSVLGWDAAAEPGAVIFFGDSPNDEPMFRRFELSCGVANIRDFGGLLRHPPLYVTQASHGHGFAEACARILRLRGK